MTPEEFHGSQLRVLLAVVELHRRGAVTVGAVANAVSLCRARTHVVLTQLRDGGWVDWTDRHHGTLHPKVRRVL